MSDICTWLYTPASSASKLEKALNRGADAVIFDLEDAVDIGKKVAARAELVEFLDTISPATGYEGGHAEGPQYATRSRIYVRVNALDSPWGAEDLRAISEIAAVEGVRVPKVESLGEVRRIESIVGRRKKVQLLIESAVGLGALEQLCLASGSTSVSLGDNDLRAELNLEGESVLEMLRTRLVVALAAAGKEAPSGSVYPRIKDLDGLRSDSLRLRGMGFFGRSVLHPMQLDTVRESFRPDSREIEWAHSVVEAANKSASEGHGAIMLPDGQFVDRPFVVRAETILERAGVEFSQL
ncbi:MAG: HpcH/HpaI aldolase/citrate lyase family protein [Brevibacterium sp.]